MASASSSAAALAVASVRLMEARRAGRPFRAPVVKPVEYVALAGRLRAAADERVATFLAARVPEPEGDARVAVRDAPGRLVSVSELALAFLVDVFFLLPTVFLRAVGLSIVRDDVRVLVRFVPAPATPRDDVLFLVATIQTLDVSNVGRATMRMLYGSQPHTSRHDRTYEPLRGRWFIKFIALA